MKNYLFGIGAILVVVAISSVVYLAQPTEQPTVFTTPTTTPTAAVTTPSSPLATPTTPTTPPVETLYENGQMKVSIPAGWTATEAITKSETGPAGSPTVTTSPNEYAVNITKGKWILYINVNAGQASGTPGGRFAEIAMGSPSADIVVIEQPAECGQEVSSSAYGIYSRVDLSVSAADAKAWCATPTNGKTVWFFSYITSPGNGYFNYYQPDQAPGLVITMSYNTDVVNDLPEMGSAELKAALKEMTDIAATLVVKHVGG